MDSIFLQQNKLLYWIPRILPDFLKRFSKYLWHYSSAKKSLGFATCTKTWFWSQTMKVSFLHIVIYDPNSGYQVYQPTCPWVRILWRLYKIWSRIRLESLFDLRSSFFSVPKFWTNKNESSTPLASKPNKALKNMLTQQMLFWNHKLKDDQLIKQTFEYI